MGDYDKVIKENIEAIFLPLLEKFTGVKVVTSTEIKDKIQRTVEREPDFLKRIMDVSGREFILQLEFQAQDDMEMVYRMTEYKALLQRKYRLPIKQFVIYLGDGTPNMRTMLREEEWITGFELKDIHRFAPGELSGSSVPQEVILGILSNYSRAEADKVISSIILKLQALSKSQAELEGYLKQLIVLSRLRKLELETKQKVDDMPITYDITTDGLYKQGIEQGIEQGVEQKTFKTISRAIRQGILTVEQIAEMEEVTVDYVLGVKAQVENDDQ